MTTSKMLLLMIMLAVLVSYVTAQYGGLGSFDFFPLGFGGKPFGKPGLGDKPGGFVGKPGFGGIGGSKPGKPGSSGNLGGLGALGDLLVYLYKGPEDTGAEYYNWNNPPAA